MNILVQELINMTTPFYEQISKYSKAILGNISGSKQLKMHPTFEISV